MGAGNADASGSDAGFENTKKSKVSFVNYNPPKQNKYTPTSLNIAGEILDNLTGAPKKNKEFMVNNYNRIGKNYNLPDRKIFDNMDVKSQNKVYSEMRSNFQRNNLNPFGESIGGGNGKDNIPTILKKTAGGQTVQTTAPTEAEVSQSAAADAEAYDLRKTKKKGRSMTRLTSSKGVTDDKLTLGKPSLLGA